jgi:cysteinyl-tRNA synthetase
VTVDTANVMMRKRSRFTDNEEKQQGLEEGSKTQSANIKFALSEEEIQEKVETRTSARRNRDFRLADTIKAELMSSGVELLDEVNEWRSLDGKLSGIRSVITHLFAL